MIEYDYMRDGNAIYEKSFAIIRSEAEAEIAVRMIHAAGSPEVAQHFEFSPGFVEAARNALKAGAPIFCDPGVFAMAAAICEAIESGLAEWRQVDLQIVPGVTAMLAVAARIGAPLSHAWRVISSQGQRLVKEGRQLNSAEENLSELASQAKTFADNLLPILRSAQIA